MGADFRPKLPKGGLSPSQLLLANTLAQALHKKRLSWAEAENVPMGRMLSNMAISDLALKPPGNLKELSKAAGIRGSFVRAHGDEVLALVREYLEKSRAGELKPESEERGPRDVNRRKREDALKAWRAEQATARKVTPSVVLPNPLLDALVSRPPADLDTLRALPYLGDKRARLYGESLLAVLAQFPVHV